VDDASHSPRLYSYRLHRGFVADMLIAFGVLEVDNDGLRVLGELLDFILQDVSDYIHIDSSEIFGPAIG
jgi:hypothetical protein